MNFLEPDSDRAVRDAVDAFFDGRLRSAIAGDAVFETKNSRYRLRDGTISAATDARLVGYELVGWLQEDGQARVSAWWAPGARAVLLDRRAGRHIVVTSVTLMLEVNGKLVDGSDSRPSGRPTGRPGQPAVAPPVTIPRAPAVPRWVQMAVSEMPSDPIAATPPPPPSVPITPSTPPPRGSTLPLIPPPSSRRSSVG
jgi:hypothetical protein